MSKHRTIITKLYSSIVDKQYEIQSHQGAIDQRRSEIDKYEHMISVANASINEFRDAIAVLEKSK